MSTMRIDGRASAKLWAKRMAKLVEYIEEDGGQVFLNVDTNDLAIRKDGKSVTILGKDVSDEF